MTQRFLFALVCAGIISARGCLVAAEPIDWPTLDLVPVVTNSFSEPTTITHAGDGTGRLFIEEQVGLIWVIQSNSVLPQPFLDIRDRVLSEYERGLLGLAFAPDYKSTGHFYVFYTRRPDGALVVSRFLAQTNTGEGLSDTEQLLLTNSHPFARHNGGQLAFGPDGFLYIGTGDNGALGIPHPAQDPRGFLGKLLRIDVRGGTTSYAVPLDNPFVTDPNYAPEIWALGLRNPWRFSFDRLTGDLYIGDVGESVVEEIDYQAAGSPGGQNYGWPMMEAIHSVFTEGFTNFQSLTPPVAWYFHSFSLAAVTGGYIYRGPVEPRMDGIYFYADSPNGWVRALKRNGLAWEDQVLLSPGTIYNPNNLTNRYISTFGRMKAAVFIWLTILGDKSTSFVIRERFGRQHSRLRVELLKLEWRP